MKVGEIEVGITADLSGLQKGVKSVSQETNKMKDAFGSAARSIAGIFSAGLLIKGLNDSIKAFGEQEEATAKLNGALRAQSIYSKELSNSFHEQAKALQSLTTFGDEAILSGQAFALSMGLSADTIKTITPLVLDFAAAMNVDLQTAFRVMGQAASGDTGMLKRYGIVIDESELKTKGFNAVLEKMSANFSGVSQELAGTGIGSLKQFNNAVGDLKEEIGGRLVPVLQWAINLLNQFGGKNQNKAVEERAHVEKMITRILSDQNTTEQTRIQLMRAIEDQNQKMMNVIVRNYEKENVAAKKAVEYKVDLSEAWQKRLQEERDKELKAEEEKQNKLNAIAQKAADEKAAYIKAVQDEISYSFGDALVEMLSQEQSFGETVAGLWQNLKMTFLKVLAEEVIGAKIAAAAKIAAEQAVAAAKTIAAYAGIPFAGQLLAIAGVVALGNMFSKYVKGFATGIKNVSETGMAMIHKGEAIIPANQNPYMGKTLQPAMAGAGAGGDFIVNITDPVVKSESDWDRITRRYIIPSLKRYRDKTYNSPYA